ncbi:hypothetical protein BC962_2962 [Gillisia mitskevichiae]|uniref:Lipoprotein n=1 Tax=Gillisia mitskevichiae TaxID=270921 RepID=A0A495NZZ1_9FLAO|nr:hypothetical protein [Gillisia mitskevichiae]RKS43406.1 hypothetical protein BC962_2962 [Gillisia mitskevichiae]
MKARIIILLVITALFASCKDSNNESVSEEKINSETSTERNENVIDYSNSEGIPNDSDILNSKNNTPASNKTTKDEKSSTGNLNSDLTGNYIKIGEEIDNSCTCYCVNITYTANSEMCLTPSKVYINTRMVKSTNGTINIFLVNPSSKNTDGKNIPWSKFDKNTPIAKIISKENGEIELDWLGFTINGDLALDYAILGKKTLEGNYKKK